MSQSKDSYENFNQSDFDFDRFIFENVGRKSLFIIFTFASLILLSCSDTGEEICSKKFHRVLILFFKNYLFKKCKNGKLFSALTN